MSLKKYLLVWLACVGLLASPSWAQAPKKATQPKKAAASAPAGQKVVFQDVKLKNGLRCILVEDHAAPVVALAMTFNVGSRDEVRGRTGFAHLFEHMMFQGSENVGKGEHMLLVQENGGTMNGSTNSDRTNYFEAMPANQLDLMLFLESDRMRSLAVNQANLDNQRNAVQEERRLGVDNQPYGKTSEILLDTVYDNFAYKHSTIGSMDDLNAATVEDVSKFFKMYYAPNNVVLTLVGDFKPAEALAKLRHYFEHIPAQPAPPPVDMTEPEQTAERRKTVDDAFAQVPLVQVVYKAPAGNTPDFYALDMAMDILGGGESSRLYQKLVKEQQVALQASAMLMQRRGPSTAMFRFMPRPGKDMPQIEQAIYDEVERLKKEPPADWEIQKLLMGNKVQRAQQLQTALGRAMMLGQLTVYFGDPNLINTMDAHYEKVTKADIQRVVEKYLKPTNRTVVTTLPKPKAAAAAAAGK